MVIDNQGEVSQSVKKSDIQQDAHIHTYDDFIKNKKKISHFDPPLYGYFTRLLRDTYTLEHDPELMNKEADFKKWFYENPKEYLDDYINKPLNAPLNEFKKSHSSSMLYYDKNFNPHKDPYEKGE